MTRLWYLNVVHPKQTLVTGTTRDGTFLIEDGRITRPAARRPPHRLDPAHPRGDRGAHRRLRASTTEAEYYGRRFALGTVVPALRAGGFRITG